MRLPKKLAHIVSAVCSLLLCALPALSVDKCKLRTLRMNSDYCAIEKLWQCELETLQAMDVPDGNSITCQQSKVFEALRELIRVEVVLNKLPEAEFYAKCALELTRRPGFHAVDSMWMEHEIAHLKEVQECSCDAEPNYSAELALRSRTYGELAPLSLHSWRDLALNLESQSKFCQAFQALVRELTILKELHGPQHIGLAGTYMDMGRVCYKLEQFERSACFYKKALFLLCRDSVGNKLMIQQAQRELRRSCTKLASICCPLY